MGPQTISGHKKLSGAPRMPEYVADIAKVVKANPSKIIGKITKEMGTSRRTISRIVKEDLGYKSYPQESPYAHHTTGHPTYRQTTFF